MMELWKPIPGYENLYEVSSLGRIRSFDKRVDSGKCHRFFPNRFLRFGKDKKGYYRCALSNKGMSKTYKVHRLVAQAFIPNPNNLPQVNHIDGDKTNNCVDNLEWCTQSQNMKHAFDNGLNRNNGENNPAAKLSYDDIEYIKSPYIARDENFSTVALAQKFKVHRKTISRIVCGKYWKGGDADVKNKSLQASI